MLSPTGAKKLVAENIMLRKQLITVGRNRKRAPNLTLWDRLQLGFLVGLINPKRLASIAIIINPSTLIKLHKAIVRRKYSALYSNKSRRKHGPAGPSQDLINAVVTMKQHNPTFGCRRIAMQANEALGLDINKDDVYRILKKHYKPVSGDDGPSWLTFLGHMKDSLWSIDFFRCESILFKSHWVMVLMDQYTRRIIGFGVYCGDLNGVAICTMFNQIIANKTPPQYLSSDHDPLFRFHRWQANLRILEIEEIKSVPYTPMSHPFVERLIRICRNECLDRSLFWNSLDLQRKLDQFRDYFNEHRAHMGLLGQIPRKVAENERSNVINLKKYRWQSHCRGLFQLPIAA